MAYFCNPVAANLLYTNLLSNFKNHPSINREQIFNYFQGYEPGITEGAVSWRIHDLKKRDLIRDVKKGVYALNNLVPYTPTINEELMVYNAIASRFSDSHNIWETSWINEFTELQATSSMVVIEVEKKNMDTVFFAFKDRGISEVYIKPDTTVIQKYVSEANRPIVIKPLVSRSPLQTIQDIKVPTLEKILVDIYCDDKLFFAFQGNQLQRIYEKAVTSHPLNFSTLFTYAKRRNREPQIKSQFLHLSNKDIKQIIG